MVQDESFLITRFRGFYREVLRLREAVEAAGRETSAEETARSLSETGVGETEDGDTAVSEEAATVDTDAVRLTLLGVLERQSREAGEHGSLYGGVLDEARYAMAALADEVFLNAHWAGRGPWKSNLLEAQLFESRRAGELVFERIDDLLAHPDPARNDLARIYLMLLGLGFQGRYRDLEGGQSQLASYGRRLFIFIANRDTELQEGARHLFPEAYDPTPGGKTAVRLPHLRPWLLGFVLILLLWLVGSHEVWLRLTSDFMSLRQVLPP